MRNARNLLAALVLILCCAALLGGCACGCHTRTSHGPETVKELKAQRETLKAQRKATARALAAEAENQRGISEKSGRYEFLRSELERLDWEICSINCEIYPH